MIGHYIRFLGSRNTLLLLRCVSSRPAFLFSGEKKTTSEQNTSPTNNVDKPENGKKPNGKDQVQQEKEGQNNSSDQVHNRVKPESNEKPKGKDQVQGQNNSSDQVHNRVKPESNEKPKGKDQVQGQNGKPYPHQVQNSPKKPLESQNINLLIETLKNNQKLGQEKRKYEIRLSIILIGIGLYTAWQSKKGVDVAQKGAAKQEEEKRKKEQGLLEKYGTKSLKIEPYYVAGNSIQQYFRFELEHSGGEYVRFYSGSSGSGKSAALRFLVNEMRQSGKQVFYCNLRQQDQKNKKKNKRPMKESQKDESTVKSHQQTFKIIQELPDIMNLALSRSTQTQRPILIIDDANLIQDQIYNGSELTNLYLAITNLPNGGVDVFMISSSSSYCQKAKKRSIIKKKSLFYVVQQKDPSEKRKEIQSIMSYYSMGNYKQTIDYLCDQDHSLRTVVEYVSTDQPQIKSDEKFLGHIKQKDQTLQIDYLTIVGNETANKRLGLQILKAIIKQGDKVTDIDCKSMKLGLQKRDSANSWYNGRSFDQFNKTLEQQNLIFYCHPRSNFIRSVFEQKIKEMEQGQPQNR